MSGVERWVDGLSSTAKMVYGVILIVIVSASAGATTTRYTLGTTTRVAALEAADSVFGRTQGRILARLDELSVITNDTRDTQVLMRSDLSLVLCLDLASRAGEGPGNWQTCVIEHGRDGRGIEAGGSR
jgi:hypothetical protein